MPKDPATRKVPRGAQRRKQLIDVAEKMLLERGFPDTTMQMIAEAAGASKETLYRHFESKELLFAEIISRKAHQISGPDTPMARGGSPETVLTELGRQSASHHRHRRSLVSFQNRCGRGCAHAGTRRSLLSARSWADGGAAHAISGGGLSKGRTALRRSNAGGAAFSRRGGFTISPAPSFPIDVEVADGKGNRPPRQSRRIDVSRAIRPAMNEGTCF